jgi:multimeric flavodoxin WrbA
MDTTTHDIAAVYGSPRRKGNTAALLRRAVEGAAGQGASVDEIVLRDYSISPCLEIYGCKKDGECVIKDDFQAVRDRILACRGLMIATPIFFYTVSAHVKLFMDRCQSLWVKKYWIDKTAFNQWTPKRSAFLIAVGATRGKRLFDGTLLTMKYFFDVFDMAFEESLLARGLDAAEDVQGCPELLESAYEKGAAFYRSLTKDAG